MGTRVKWCLSSRIGFVYLFVIMFFMPSLALSEETYKFERMWPNIQQPWFFNSPHGIAIDVGGNIYVADEGNNRIQKFSPDGALITRWGSYGIGDGQFNRPSCIAIDGNGNVYVTEWNSRIQKFTANGEFITKWGSYGSGDGQFIGGLIGIAADSSGNIYVVDSGNYRIQKFSSDGTFITKWGSYGSGDGEFDWKEGKAGIAIDGSGNVYVVDSGNFRIQKFSSNGMFLSKWGSEGSGDGEFGLACGIAIDVSGSVYVTDADFSNHLIQKFNANGEFITKWGSHGPGDGEIGAPYGIAVDSSGNIYMTDSFNNRIQKFTANGEFTIKWGTDGSGNGEFRGPHGIAADNSGNVYVADAFNGRIQKFTANGEFTVQWGKTDPYIGSPSAIAADNRGNVYVSVFGNSSIKKFSSNGTFITKWGSQGSGDGEFDQLYGIAVDNSGNVYVTDSGNHRIQKFTSDGIFISKWGTGDGEFDYPYGIAVDSNGNVYVTDVGGRLQKFTSNGVFITKWGEGWGDPFAWPRGIAIDGNGNVYVADGFFNCIYKFTADGEFITQIGEAGTDQGQLSGLNDLCVASNGSVYVADTANNRIQVFSQEGPPVSDTSKAIIVAGGGPYAGNNLWDATEMCANYAYRALIYQGYTKETIYYLSSDTGLDLDGNGKPDDVDADATNANLQYAINTWAKDAEDLFIYMVDHGGNGTFRMGETELLYATSLDAWLDTLQETLPGCVTMVYDACESGSFLPYLLPPSGKQRILATSTSSGEESIFVGNGTVSFSFLFWGHMFNGDSFYDAFVNAKQSVSATYNLTPQLDGDGNGIGNEKADKDAANLIRVGNETKSAGDVPVIGSVSPAQTLAGATSATLYADQVIDANGISRVWAVITPPGYSPGSAETPVTDLPTIDLSSVGNNRYEATYTNFTASGAYNIAIFAMDRKGVLSLPVQTSVTTASSCLAVAGDLSIRVPCAEYNGDQYGFVLGFYRNPDDPSGYYWNLVMATLAGGTGADVIPIGGDLSMPIPCAAHNGTQYGFTLDFYNNHYDPSGYYWKMDMSTLEVK